MKPWERTWEQASGPSQPVNQQREAGWTDRALGGLKMTEAGRINFLRSKYGERNVATADDGNVFIRDTQRGEWYPFDRAGFTAKDFADLSGEAVQALPLVRAGTIGRAAVAGLAGNLARQGGSALVPGDDEMSLGQRATSAAIDTGLGAGAQAAVNTGARVFDALRPRNIVSRQFRKGLASPVGQESQRIEQALGEQFTPGQATQSRSALTIEGLLRRHPATADMVASKDEALLQATRRRLDRALDGMSTTGDPTVAGSRVRSAFDATLDAAIQTRRNQAKVDFAAVDSAAGRAPIFQMQSAAREIDQLIESFGTPAAGDASAALVNQLRNVRKELDKPLTAQNVERLLEIWGAASRGSGRVFKDLDTAQQRMIASRVLAAFDQDLARVADGVANDNVARALQAARKNYRMNSQAINELGESTIGKYLGTSARAPEEIFQRIRTMKSTQAGETFRLLQRADPEMAQAVKRTVFEDALERAKPPAQRIEDAISSGATPEGEWSPARFLSNLKDSWVWGQLTPNEKVEFQTLTGAMQRQANRAGTDGSPTAPLQFAFEVVKGLGRSAAGLDVLGAAQIAGSALAPRIVAPLMTTPEGRRALLKVYTTKRGTKAFEAAALTMAALLAKPKESASAPNAELDAALAQGRGSQVPPWQRNWQTEGAPQ